MKGVSGVMQLLSKGRRRLAAAVGFQFLRLQSERNRREAAGSFARATPSMAMYSSRRGRTIRKM